MIRGKQHGARHPLTEWDKNGPILEWYLKSCVEPLLWEHWWTEFMLTHLQAQMSLVRQGASLTPPNVTQPLFA
jgi:hypothetical protein